MESRADNVIGRKRFNKIFTESPTIMAQTLRKPAFPGVPGNNLLLREPLAVVMRSHRSEKAMPMSLPHPTSETPRQRNFRLVRLSLGGAALGTAVLGIAAKLSGFADHALIDIVGAAVGASIAAIVLISASRR